MSDVDRDNGISRDSKEPTVDARGQGWLSRVAGWVLIPGTVAGLIFGGGVLAGAHFHDSWFAEAILWLAERF